MPEVHRIARVPGRVNLIGDHTDYTGGLALPMAIPMATTATFTEHPTGVLSITSDAMERPVEVELGTDVPDLPSWARLAQYLAQQLNCPGGSMSVTTTVPLGAGLSSSASYAVAVALALGATGDAWELAELAQAAEAAAGANVGLLDQVAVLSARAGFATAINFTARTVTPVEIPPTWQFLIVDSGERRSLATSAYGDRRASCAAAAAIIGPIATARLENCSELPADLAPFARHVMTENARVTSSIAAARTDDAVTFGRLMTESHQSLSKDFLVSTPGIDALVHDLNATPGIYGARMTGGGFGGCVVALCNPVVVDREGLGGRGWFVAPSAGATVTDRSGAVTILAAT